MNVRELLRALRDCDADAPVLVLVDGEEREAFAVSESASDAVVIETEE